jgi:glycerol-1-phosphate dehydrogenase [NAD(P)+]
VPSPYEGIVVPERPKVAQVPQHISPGAWRKAAAYCQSKGYGSIVVVTDAVIDRHFGRYVEKCFGDTVTFIDGPTAKKAGEASREAYVLRGASVIVGLGGGTNIDQAKMFAKCSERPWIALPTKPTAAILSGHASVVINGTRVSEPTPLAEAVFIDQSLFRALDPMCAKAELGDSLSSLTAVGDAYLSKMDLLTTIKPDLLKDAYTVASEALIIEDIHSTEGISKLYQTNLRYAEIMNAYGSSLPCSGSEHAISHALDAMGSSQLHGIQVGFTTLVGTHLQSSCEDLADALRREGIDQVSTEELQVALTRHGFPTRLSELGISRERFESALHLTPAVRASDDKRYTVLDRYNVDEVLEKLVKAGLV